MKKTLVLLTEWQEDNVEVEKPLEKEQTSVEDNTSDNEEKEQTSVEDNTSDNEENKASQVEIPDWKKYLMK